MQSSIVACACAGLPLCQTGVHSERGERSTASYVHSSSQVQGEVGVSDPQAPTVFTRSELTRLSAHGLSRDCRLHSDSPCRATLCQSGSCVACVWTGEVTVNCEDCILTA
jgi:hypothetical protein